MPARRVLTPGTRADERWSSTRIAYLDNLKVAVVAAVIMAHGALSFVDAEDGWWPYANVQEVQLSPAAQGGLFAVVGPFALFLMALMFLLAGLLTPASLDHKGPARFARDRLLRLGVPFAMFVLLLWPLLLYALYRPLGHATGTYWEEFVDNSPDTGPLWFVGLLLLLSLAYAGWCSIRPSRLDSPRPVPITLRSLLLLALLVTVGSFLLRLAAPYGTQTVLDLNEWQWPECLAMFGLGIVAARQGWLTTIPDRLRRQARTASVVAIVAVAMMAFARLRVPVDDFLGGWHWAALAFAAVEGVLTVFGSIWLLSVAQRRLDRRFRHGPALGRSAYAAYVVQVLVLIALAVAMRPVPVVAEIKALVVAVLGAAGSFAIAHLLVTRVPWFARVL